MFPAIGEIAGDQQRLAELHMGLGQIGLQRQCAQAAQLMVLARIFAQMHGPEPKPITQLLLLGQQQPGAQACESLFQWYLRR